MRTAPLSPAGTPRSASCCATSGSGKDYVERTIRRYGPKIMDEPVYPQHEPLDAASRTRRITSACAASVVTAFTARRVEDMRPRIQQIVDETLDRIIPQGEDGPDRGFRLPPAGRPSSATCSESPRSTARLFYNGSRDGGRLLDPVPLTAEEIKQGNAGNADGRDVLPPVVRAAAQRSPATTSTTQLVQAEEDGQKLTNEELTANIILLFGAGPRDHREPDRQRPAGAASQSRSARAAQGQSRLDHQRDRGIPSL